jgi:hypothetical protein
LYPLQRVAAPVCAANDTPVGVREARCGAGGVMTQAWCFVATLLAMTA